MASGVRWFASGRGNLGHVSFLRRARKRDATPQWSFHEAALALATKSHITGATNLSLIMGHCHVSGGWQQSRSRWKPPMPGFADTAFLSTMQEAARRRKQVNSGPAMFETWKIPLTVSSGRHFWMWGGLSSMRISVPRQACRALSHGACPPNQGSP